MKGIGQTLVARSSRVPNSLARCSSSEGGPFAGKQFPTWLSGLTWRSVSISAGAVAASATFGDLTCQALEASKQASSTNSVGASDVCSESSGAPGASNVAWADGPMGFFTLWDGARTARMAGVSSLTGAAGLVWFLFLESRLPGKGLRLVLLKTGATACYALGVGLPTTFTLVTLLRPEGSISAVRAKIGEDLLPTWAAGLFYWPFVCVFTFSCVSTAMRAPVNSVFGTVWQVYLSHRTNLGSASSFVE
ncbi:unnamed protein product [Polarella glacialis]|uniref:Uncharacterized protein n=1 Tax=Polarella glacialis TaxID=89957 RepID=A0A813IDU9_POLGL|nr:unnamed protein product [Polarella glacialis]CAE8649435.1 unnamed protein product [Polarella glacialis]